MSNQTSGEDRGFSPAKRPRFGSHPARRVGLGWITHYKKGLPLVKNVLCTQSLVLPHTEEVGSGDNSGLRVACSGAHRAVFSYRQAHSVGTAPFSRPVLPGSPGPAACTTPDTWGATPDLRHLPAGRLRGKCHTHSSHHQFQSFGWRDCVKMYMATSLRTVPSSYSGKGVSTLSLRTTLGDRGPGLSEEGRKSNSAQPSQNLGRLKWHWAWPLINLTHLSPQHQWTPNSSERLGMKPNWVVWVWRRPDSLQHGEGGQGRSPETHAGPHTYSLQRNAELRRPSYWVPPPEGHGGKSTSVKPNCLHGLFFKERICSFTDSKWPNGFSESTNLITSHPLSVWQGQFNTFYLCCLCGCKFSTIVDTVQASENITEHLKAVAAGRGR